MEPDHHSEAVSKGVDLLQRGVTDFPKWSRVMVYNFGEEIRPHLDRIWTLSERERGMRPAAPPTPPLSDQFPANCGSKDVMKQESLYRLAVLVLLGGILLVQLQVLNRLKGRVKVDVQNSSLDVDVKNTFPLEVDVRNAPLEVQIVR